MSIMILGYTSPLLTYLHNTVQDRLEQCYRHARRCVRPFRYWDFLRVLKIAHHSLALSGLVVFWISNRLIGSAGSVSNKSFFRRSPASWNQAACQLSWFVMTALGGCFPFYFVRHPTRDSWFRNWAHPMTYWGFLGVYKMVWSTWHAVAIADFLADPRRNPPPSTLARKYSRLWKSWQRERIVTFQNLRYQHQWGKIIQELHNTENQRLVKAVRIDNRWVALGGFGSAVQDVLDDILDRHLMRPARVATFFQRLGQAFPLLTEVSIAMTLNLPLQAVSQLLEYAPSLAYLRLDGIALSVHDLQPDLLEFGRSLHGVGSQRQQLNLKTLLLENCRLENDEPDPQLRTRYSMDLLLAPALYTALTPPTRLLLTHLKLWVQCQRISVLELAVMLGQNNTLTTLDLHLTKDNSNDNDNDQPPPQQDEVEDAVDWIVLPLAQVLQYRNSKLTNLSIQLPAAILPNSLSRRALIQMIQSNETLHTCHLIRSDTQATIRIPEVDFYLHCNQLGRRDFELECASEQYINRRWIDMLSQQKRNTAVVYYFLSRNPPLLLAMQQPKERTKSLRKAWQWLLQGKHAHAHWNNTMQQPKEY